MGQVTEGLRGIYRTTQLTGYISQQTLPGDTTLYRPSSLAYQVFLFGFGYDLFMCREGWPRFPLLTSNQWPKPQAQVAVVYPPPNSSVVLRQRRNASHPTAHVSIQIRHTGSWYHIFTAEHPYDAI